MKKTVIFGAILFVIGVSVALSAYFIGGVDSFDIDDLSFGIVQTEIEYDEKQVSTLYTDQDIVINDKNSDVVFQVSTDEKIYIKYQENENEIYEIDLENVIYIKREIKSKWYNNIFRIEYASNRPTLTVYIPDDYKGNISVETNSGVIKASDILVQDFIAETNNGDILLTDMQISAQVELTTSNGEIKLDNFSSADLNIKNTNGKIELIDVISDNNILAQNTNGTIIAKQIQANTNIEFENVNGEIIFEHIIVGETINIKNKIGNIQGSIKDLKEYFNILSSSSTEINNLVDQEGTGVKNLNVYTTLGSIEIEFVD